MRPEYDLAVIGSGAAAFAAAIAASDLGKRVVLTESNQVGEMSMSICAQATLEFGRLAMSPDIPSSSMSRPTRATWRHATPW